MLLSKVVRRQKVNRRSELTTENEQQQQDTRRYARSWLMAGEAVPRDFNSNPSTLSGVREPSIEDEELQALSAEGSTNAEQKPDDEYNLATFLRHGSPDIKQATIVENPRCSATFEDVSGDVDQDNNAVQPEEDGACPSSNPNALNNQLAIDYDRIISYLGILKETST